MNETIRGEYMTMREAADLLGVGRFRIAALLKREGIQTFKAPDDWRKKWVRWEDVERLATPRLLTHG